MLHLPSKVSLTRYLLAAVLLRTLSLVYVLHICVILNTHFFFHACLLRFTYSKAHKYAKYTQKARRTLELPAELAASRARLLSRMLKCAVNFRENFASRGSEEKIYRV